MRIGLVGAGAVGAVLAQKLNRVSEFYLIVDEKRKQLYQTDGIYINDEQCFFNCITKEESIPLDFIILAVKNYQLDEAIEEITPFVNENTILLSLLNGVESEEKLSKHFPLSKVLYAFIKGVSSVKEGNRVICFVKSGGIICFGERNNEITENIERVKTIFDKAEICYEVPLNILHEQWWKFMLNCCFNTISAILLTPYSKICTNEPLFRAVRMACSEIVKVANAEGIQLTYDDVNKVIALMETLTDEGKTSMLQDMEAGRKTENNYFCGTVIKLGKKHGIETPVCAFLYQLLEAASYARS